MPPLPAPDYEPNRGLASQGIDVYPSNSGDVLNATAEDAFARNPLPSLMRMYSRAVSEFGVNDEAGNKITAPSPLMTAEDANKQYGIPGKLKFDADTTEFTASELNRLKQDELKRNSILARAQGDGFAQFAVGLGVSALDPLNVASAFIPVVGEARYAAWLAKAGESAIARAGVRTGVGALEGGFGAALVEPLVYAGARSEQADYTMMDSMLNIGFGTVLGGGLHAGLGRLGDLLDRRRLTEPALKGAAAALSDDRPVMVAESLRSELLRSTAFGDATKIFNDLIPEDIRAPKAEIFDAAAHEAERLNLMERLIDTGHEFISARNELDRLIGEQTQRTDIGTAVRDTEQKSLRQAIDDTNQARTDLTAKIEEVQKRADEAKALLDRAEGRANTLRDAGVAETDRKLVRAEKQADEARGPYQAVLSELEALGRQVGELETKRSAQVEQLSNFVENAKTRADSLGAQTTPLVDRARERLQKAESALGQVEAERDQRIRQAREDAQIETRRTLQEMMRPMSRSDAAEVAAIDRAVSTPEARRSGSEDLTDIRSDLDSLDRQIDELRASIPENELKHIDEAAGEIEAAELRAKAIEAAGACERVRG